MCIIRTIVSVCLLPLKPQGFTPEELVAEMKIALEKYYVVGLLLYTDFEIVLLNYVNNHWKYLHRMIGKECCVYIPETPEELPEDIKIFWEN